VFSWSVLLRVVAYQLILRWRSPGTNSRTLAEFDALAGRPAACSPSRTGSFV
jgi:hypothetical protein